MSTQTSINQLNRTVLTHLLTLIVVLSVIQFLFANHAGSHDWPIARITLNSKSATTYHLSLHAHPQNAGGHAQTQNHTLISSLGQPIIGTSSNTTTSLHHGAITVFKQQQLSAPVQLFARAVSGYQINLDWIDTVDGEDMFILERRQVDTSFETIVTLAPDTIQYEDYAVEPGTFYIYRVVAVAGGESSEYSNLASATTPLKGDANLDGIVDLSDLAILATRFGQAGFGWTGGDYNKDGQVNLSDLAALATNFGSNHPQFNHSPDGIAYVETTYDVIDLGTLGGDTSLAHDLNESNQVVGGSITADFASHAFLWEDGQMIDLGLSPNSTTLAYGINNAEIIVGQTRVNGDTIRAVDWVDRQSLDHLHPDANSQFSRKVNNAGLTAGYASIINQQSQLTFRAYIFDGVNYQWLPTGPMNNSWAEDINNNNIVVGFLRNEDNKIQAAYFQNETYQLLTPLSAERSSAHGINDVFQIAGQSDNAASHARAVLWYRNQIQQLGTLSGDTSIAYDVNDAGQVVGVATLADDSTRAFIYTRRYGLRNLNNLISNPAWTLLEARAINNRGCIVGKGIINGQTHAFLLIPIESDIPLD